MICPFRQMMCSAPEISLNHDISQKQTPDIYQNQ